MIDILGNLCYNIHMVGKDPELINNKWDSSRSTAQMYTEVKWKLIELMEVME